MKFNLYSTLWMDPAFYIAAGVFALALFLLVFSIRKYLEIKNGSDFEEPGDRAEEIQGELPLTAVDVTREPAVAQDAAAAALRVEAQAESPAQPSPFASSPAPIAEAMPIGGAQGQKGWAQPAAAQAEAPEAPKPAAAAAQPDAAAHASSRAEEFVKGLYQNMSSLDARLKNIEAAFSKRSVNRDFAVTFLEDMISDYDSLDKEKIKARIEYLVADLKK